MNYILDCLDFEEQIVRIIPKVENTFEHKDQSGTINDTARAMQSMQYDQRYNQDKSGDGNGYIASSTYVKTRGLSKKPDVQEVNIGR